MVRMGVPESVSRDLIGQVYGLEETAELDDLWGVRSAIAQIVRAQCPLSRISSAESGQSSITMVVGPSGSGKTSILVKLAAELRLQGKQRVALISADTYRVAAAEQLRSLGELLEVSVEIVSTPREMRRAVMNRPEVDCVLIDTAGRNARDQAAMNELESLLNQARPDRVHLVLSATETTGQLRDCVAAFAAVGANSLVLTKLDEASRLGHLVPVLSGSPLPLSYLSSGQNLRSDLWPADLDRLLPRMLGGYVPRGEPTERRRSCALSDKLSGNVSAGRFLENV
jgi:flagellar biosynthesis protein FlhF